jgi:hypothetical protein
MRHRITIAAAALLASACVQAQALKAKGGPGGTISVGGRSSFSLFNGGDASSNGTGLGGQFRMRIAERVNTDWFYDYLTAPIGDFAHRQDQHIGWSVLYYVRAPRAERMLLQPYVLAGHCFDYTRQMANGDASRFAERWSSAMQAGAGTHLNLTDRFDLSLVAQYMIHLGTDVHAEQHDGEVEFHREHGGSLEGHLLFHFSFNYKLFDAW